VRRAVTTNVCWQKSSCKLFPLAATHAKVANSGNGKMVIACYRTRYFFQKRATLQLTLLENQLATVTRYFSSSLLPCSGNKASWTSQWNTHKLKRVLFFILYYGSCFLCLLATLLVVTFPIFSAFFTYACMQWRTYA